MRRSPSCLRFFRVLTAIGLTAALAAGCAPGPSSGPPLAVVDGHESTSNDGSDESPSEPPPAPESWSEGLSRIGEDARFGECRYLESDLPADVTRECLSFSPGGALASEGKELYAALVTSPEADRTKPPLVIASGADRSFSAVVDTWARALADGLSWPVVVIESRTQLIGHDTCQPPVDVAGDELVAADAAPTDPETRRTATEVARGCQDATGELALEFGARGSAADIDIVADRLGLENFVLGGAGSGIRPALRYAADNPDSVAAMVADSPTNFGGDLTEQVSAQAEGAQMALGSWAGQCEATDCLSGPVPSSTTPFENFESSPAGAAALRYGASALSGVQNSEPDDRKRMFELFAGAASGNPPRGAVPTSDIGTRELFSTCTDFPVRASTEDRGAMIDDLGERFPTFGRSMAIRTGLCNDWPVVDAEPLTLPQIPALVLGTTGGDPLAGRDPAGTGSAALTAAGAAGAIPLRYGGFGSAAAGTGACIAEGINAFLVDPAATEPTACPA